MWHKRKNAKAEFATIQEPALVGFRSAKRLHPFGVAECFASQNPPTRAFGCVNLFCALSVIASFAMAQELLYNSHRLDDDVLTVEKDSITISKFFGEIFIYAQNNFLCLYFDNAIHNTAFYAHAFQ